MTEIQEIRTELQAMAEFIEGHTATLEAREYNGWLIREPKPLELDHFLRFVIAETPADNREPMPLPAWPVLFVAIMEGKVSLNDRRVLGPYESDLLHAGEGGFIRALAHPTKIVFVGVRLEGYRGPQNDNGATPNINSPDRTPFD
jgi:hypothetical protein